MTQPKYEIKETCESWWSKKKKKKKIVFLKEIYKVDWEGFFFFFWKHGLVGECPIL